MEFDVVIVGAGPGWLSAAIRLNSFPESSIVVVEKGSEVGAHILSGAVIDPVGFDRLLPDWRKEDTPIKTAVTDDRFYMLTQARAFRLPNVLLPPLMSNHGNFIVSLGDVCRWLAGKAEALGVEIYPGCGERSAVRPNGESRALQPVHGLARRRAEGLVCARHGARRTRC
jgi:electron-transferring-flavoprotein dehydrogenase